MFSAFVWPEWQTLNHLTGSEWKQIHMDEKSILDRPPGIEAVITFNTSSKTAVSDGYRPPHMLVPGVLTTGVQHYQGVSSVAPGASVHGTITFLSPECALHSL